MNPVDKKIQIDLWQKSFINISPQQYDKDFRTITVEITDGLEVLSIPNDETVWVKIRYEKPDGKPVYNDCSINEDGTVTIQLTEQMLAVEGEATAQLEIIDISNEQNKVVKTQPFKFKISKSILAQEAITSSYEFDTLNNLVFRVEADFKEAHELLAEMNTENILWQANEETRKNNEEIRVRNEEIRERYESYRQAHEEDRRDFEQDRQANEEVRVTQETERVSETATVINDCEQVTAKCREIVDNIDKALLDDDNINTNKTYSSKKIEKELANKQSKLTFDNIPKGGSSNPVTSEGIYGAIQITYEQSTGYTDNAINKLIGGAPETLDTLKEIADSLNENEEIMEAINTAIGSKADKVYTENHINNDTVHVTASDKENLTKVGVLSIDGDGTKALRDNGTYAKVAGTWSELSGKPFVNLNLNNNLLYVTGGTLTVAPQTQSLTYDMYVSMYEVGSLKTNIRYDVYLTQAQLEKIKASSYDNSEYTIEFKTTDEDEFDGDFTPTVLNNLGSNSTTSALSANMGRQLDATKLSIDGSCAMEGSLRIRPLTGSDGGTVCLEPVDGDNTTNGIKLSAIDGSLEIGGIPSLDEASIIGEGTPLVINPYDKTISGNYTFYGKATGLTSTSIGSSVRPVYFDSNGVPKAIDYTINASVPSNAKFTDTNTWRSCADNLTSTATNVSLSANQGRILNESINSNRIYYTTYTATNIAVTNVGLGGSYYNEGYYWKGSEASYTDFAAKYKTLGIFLNGWSGANGCVTMYNIDNQIGFMSNVSQTIPSITYTIIYMLRPVDASSDEDYV